MSITRSISAFAFLCLFAAAPFNGSAQNDQAGNEPTAKLPVSDDPISDYLLAGQVKSEGGDPLIGVVVSVEGLTVGAETDFDGKFELRLPVDKPHKLKFTYAGYETQTVDLKANQVKIMVEMVSETAVEDVVVSASRTPETIMQSPVTIEKIDALAIKEAPAGNMYDALANVKGVEMIATGLNFKVLNTRGFNTPGNSRFVQRIDGMDMQIAGLNMPLGSVNGSSDLDIANVELMPGTSSALYGPNAFNGMLNITTKSPFDYPGLSVSVKGGATHLDGRDSKISPMNEIAARYAFVVKKRFGVKLNAAYFMGNDWYADDRRDAANYAGTTNLNYTPAGPGNPGYDGLNVYGDEVSAIFDSTIFTQDQRNIIRQSTGKSVEPVRISRTGYAEKDLVNYDTYSIKGDLGLYYKLTDKAEISVTGRAAHGRTLWMADNRVMLDGYTTYNGKVELKGGHYFLRAYVSGTDAGNSYDTRFAAMNINKMVKSDTNWMAQYQAAYFGLFNQFAPLVGEKPIKAFDDAAARAFADADNSKYIPKLKELAVILPDIADDINRFAALLPGGAHVQPGTAKFDSLLNVVKNIPNFNQGAKFTDKSKLVHVEGQYDFSKHIKFVEILAGGSFRTYIINSGGRVFSDTAGPIFVPEYGGYVQATKRFFKKRLRLSASARVDKSLNFAMQFSPRAVAVISLGKYKQHNIRASYQTGFKMPDLRHQYINFNVGTYQIVGGLPGAYEAYGLTYHNAEGQLVNNAYTESSVNAIIAGGDTAKLTPYQLKTIRPEFMRTIEIGYKGMLTRKLMVDLSYYASRYNDFIGMVSFVGPSKQDAHSGNVQLTAQDVLTRNGAGDEQFQRFRHYANASTPVTTQGASVGVAYQFNSKFSLLGNYTYSAIILTGDPNVQSQFNTPRHKTNISFTGRNLFEKFGFAVNYRFAEAYLFEYSFATGVVPANHAVDAQISYRMPKFKSTVKLGGTNLLNNRLPQVYGGPSIGSMVYLQITYDDFLN